MIELKHAFRVLLSDRGWTSVILISLALGIGANTALFSGVNGALLRTVPVSDPESLVRLTWAGANEMATNTMDYGYVYGLAEGEERRATFSYPAFEAFRESNETLTDLFAAAPYRRVNVVADGQAELATAFIASGNYFSVLEVSAQIGRVIEPEDDRVSADPVVVISHGYWARRFGENPAVVGEVINVNGIAVTIVGVVPSSYTGIQSTQSASADVHLPLTLDERLHGARRAEGTFWWLQVVGRLKPGVSDAQVEGNLSGVFEAVARSGMDTYLSGLPDDERNLERNRSRSAVPRLIVDSARRGVYDPRPDVTRDARLLAGVVVLVLLLVCANVANLLLARAARRKDELAVRMSLGATRARLVGQLVAESMLLAALGGTLGVLVAYWGQRLLPSGLESRLDVRALVFACLLSVGTALVFSLLPALRATTFRATPLRADARTSIASRGFLTRSLLAVQLAISLVVLSGAGLFLRTLTQLRTEDVGFDPSNILLFRLDPSLSGYDDDEVLRFHELVQRQLAALGGVRAVSLSRNTFLAGSRRTSTMYLPGSGSEGTRSHMMTVSPEFFETMGIELLDGRVFGDNDTQDSPRVAVVNSAGAREFFSGENAVGRRFGQSPEKSDEFEIVGVVRDVKYASVRDAAPPTVYLAHRQESARSMMFEVKTVGDPHSLAAEVTRVVRGVDPSVPVVDVTTQAEQIEQRFRQERYLALSYTVFGILATTIAAIGLFGLASYDVVRRTAEFGLRMAVGARPHDIVRLVVADSIAIVGAGVLLGLGGTYVLGRVISNLLYGVPPTDAFTIAAAGVLLVLVSVLAGLLPAVRASRVDPAVALQYE